MGYHTALNVARKVITFPLWRAIDKRWNRNTVSLVSSITAVMRLPVSWISSTVDWFQVPAVSTATGKKMWEAESVPYFTILFAAALFAAEHASLAVWCMCDSAHVSGTVTSHAMGLPCAQGSNVVPSDVFRLAVWNRQALELLVSGIKCFWWCASAGRRVTDEYWVPAVTWRVGEMRVNKDEYVVTV